MKVDTKVSVPVPITVSRPQLLLHCQTVFRFFFEIFPLLRFTADGLIFWLSLTLICGSAFLCLLKKQSSTLNFFFRKSCLFDIRNISYANFVVAVSNWAQSAQIKIRQIPTDPIQILQRERRQHVSSLVSCFPFLFFDVSLLDLFAISQSQI